MLKRIGIAVLAAAMFAGSGMFVAPRPAQADTNSTIAIAAAAIIGILLFDESNRPYYVRDGYRCYVNDDVADYYFQNNYGGWYGPHRYDWRYNRRQFAYDWNRNHYNGGGYYSGYNRGYDRPVYQHYSPPVYQRPVYNQPPANYNHGWNNSGGGNHWDHGNQGNQGNQGDHQDRSGNHGSNGHGHGHGH